MPRGDRVALLDPQTANQIAAGEVVERPASVVKELCENAIDAGARRIVVRVEEGGKRLIQVTDDGCGMSPADARLALERHATSKIRSAADLAAVLTLGFRGEALPSIASVSRFDLVTRRPEDVSGTHLAVEGGTVLQMEPAGCPPGTTVTVRDLFYNVPARLKFLKSAASELNQIADTFARLALSRPDIAFRLETGDGVAKRGALGATPGRGGVPAAAAGVLGDELARILLLVDSTSVPAAETGTVRVHGFVAPPDAARSNRQHQYFFVNGRPVRSLALRYPLEEAYHGRLMTGRYPVALLYIEVDPAAVDVNVHPTKQEVRFGQEGAVKAAIYRAVQQALEGRVLVPGMTPPAQQTSLPAQQTSLPAQPSLPVPTRSDSPWSALRLGEAIGPYLTGQAGTPPDAMPPPVTPLGDCAAAGAGVPADPGPAGADTMPPSDVRTMLAGLRPLGQLGRTYILCESRFGLFLVDQHAAHEKVYYEALGRSRAAQAPAQQVLAVPLDVELDPATWALWDEYAPALRDWGVDAEPFGGRTLLLRAVPAGFAKQPKALLIELLERLQRGEGRDALDRYDSARRAMAACKAAVKANDPLTHEGMVALLQQLAELEQPLHCPHGRPTVILISFAELERRFRRRV